MIQPNLTVTLDSIHQKFVKQKEKEQLQIPTLKKKLSETITKLKKIKLIKNCNLTNLQIEEKFQLENQIKTLQNQINHLSENKELTDYYLNVGDILYQYYDKKKNPKKYQLPTKHSKENIITFFTKNSKQPLIETPPTTDFTKGKMKYLQKKKS